ncbi:MAG: hypothetical protein J6X59_06130 [Bacteroidales bacterium]|nr:hypothetical protein [Bacteroidales bacterium]
MKQDTLQSLLDKYREGTLTDGERSELERLTHKDEVFAAARHQAAGIMRRRVALAMTALVICGAGIWALQLGNGSQTPLMAEATTPLPEAPQEVRETVAPAPATEPAPLVAEVVETKHPAAAATRKVRPTTVAPIEKPAVVASTANSTDEPVVTCNNQCDADEVISDIKKFLAYEEM